MPTTVRLIVTRNIVDQRSGEVVAEAGETADGALLYRLVHCGLVTPGDPSFSRWTPSAPRTEFDLMRVLLDHRAHALDTCRLEMIEYRRASQYVAWRKFTDGPGYFNALSRQTIAADFDGWLAVKEAC